MTVVTPREAKTLLSRLLRQVVAGEEIVISEAGVPVARLLPLASKEPRRPSLRAGSNEAGLAPELEMCANPAGTLGSER